ncbi:MAG: NAD-dependent epimerase/dehydratase family protein, partial [Bradyrhizobium sp.]
MLDAVAAVALGGVERLVGGAHQVAEIEAGLKEPVIMHGNLDSYRDYTDVRDVVRAYWVATDKCEYGVPYNI